MDINEVKSNLEMEVIKLKYDMRLKLISQVKLNLFVYFNFLVVFSHLSLLKSDNYNKKYKE